MNKDWHFREAFKEASERWGREEAGQRAGSCRLCWVLGSHTGGGEECFWRGDKTRNIFCCSWTTSWFYLYRRRWWQPWTRKTRKNNKAVAVLCNDIVIYYAVTVQIQNQQYVIQLFDTAGQEDYDRLQFLSSHQNISKSRIDLLVRLRLIAYPNTDVFLVCFSIINPDSY